MKVDFIAEVSSNHSANLDRCIEFIDKSSDIGCDAVKFQLFKINKLFSKEILKSSKEIADRKNWELPIEFLEPIAKSKSFLLFHFRIDINFCLMSDCKQV